MNAVSPPDCDNPYKAPENPLEPERDAPGNRHHFWLLFWISVQLLVVMIGLGFAFREIESIMRTGPALSAVGIIVAVLAFRRRSRWGIVLGASAPVFSLFIFLLIWIRQWSPGDASGPVPTLGCVYLGMAILLTVIIFAEARSANEQPVFPLSESERL